MKKDFLDLYFELYGDAVKTLPSIYYVWKKSQKYVESENEEEIKKFENLIFLLFNSVVSPRVKLGRNVKFAYGGIGTVVHKDSIIGNGVAIGQCVTIGGSPGRSGTTDSGTRFHVPHIKDNVYIAAGSRILGGITIGKFSIIGANSVVTSDVDDFSIYAGQPAKKINKLTKTNCFRYRSLFHDLKQIEKNDFISCFPDD